MINCEKMHFKNNDFHFWFYFIHSRYSNVWQRRTTLEKVLLSFYVILGVIVVTSLVFYFIIFDRSVGKRRVTQSTSSVQKIYISTYITNYSVA